jgi:hypothetical protein
VCLLVFGLVTGEGGRSCERNRCGMVPTLNHRNGLAFLVVNVPGTLIWKITFL